VIVLRVIVPTFLMLGSGYLAGKKASFDVPTLSNLAIYVLTPSLVFHRLYVSRMTLTTMGRIGLYALLIVVVIYLVAYVIQGFLRLRSEDRAAFLLASSLFNAGNMGLPIVLFAFGEEGLAFAIVLVVAHVLITNTAGVFVAARAHLPAWEALGQVFALPGVYAIALAFVFGQFGVQLPGFLLKPVELLGDAAIPVNTVILGIQLSDTPLAGGRTPAAVASALRLLLAPLVGLFLLQGLGFSDLAFRVLLLQTGMPSAVYSVILSAKFRANASLASTAVLLSTALSAVTLSALLIWIAR